MWPAAIALSMGIAGCNLFHPTGSNDADRDDAAALTLEGYQEFQKSNFDGARSFFNKAIRADSGYSEAWVGLCKSVLNTQEGINVFELVSYAQTQKKENGTTTTNGFLEMEDAKADTIARGIDSVMKYLNKFVDRDTLNKTDKKVRFKDIADSYTILQLTKAALRIRKVQTGLTSVISADGSGMQVNLNSLNDLGDSLKPFLEDLAAAAVAIKASPESASEIIKAYLPDSTREQIGEEFYEDATVGLANTVITLNERAQNTDEDRTDVFFSFGNIIDDDGDGCADEEILDNYDNDGDGEIDEDVRDNRAIVLVSNKPKTWQDLNNLAYDANTYDLTKAQVDSLNILEKYSTVDIDMNGKMGSDDPDEWHYVVRDPNERDEKENHLLVFAKSLKFKYAVNFSYSETDLEKLIEAKEKIRKDTDVNNIKYDLKKRQEMVGGCWNNYKTEEDFLKWFQWRDEK